MPKVVGGGFKKRCGNCGVTLEFTKSEVRAGEQLPHDPERDHKSVITCPNCHRSVDVTSVVGAISYETAAQQRWDEERYDY